LADLNIAQHLTYGTAIIRLPLRFL